MLTSFPCNWAVDKDYHQANNGNGLVLTNQQERYFSRIWRVIALFYQVKAAEFLHFGKAGALAVNLRDRFFIGS
jgi:hypothetical protein